MEVFDTIVCVYSGMNKGREEKSREEKRVKLYRSGGTTGEMRWDGMRKEIGGN